MVLEISETPHYLDDYDDPSQAFTFICPNCGNLMEFYRAEKGAELWKDVYICICGTRLDFCFWESVGVGNG